MAPLMFVNVFKNSFQCNDSNAAPNSTVVVAGTKQGGVKKIPRPRNAFMLYRHSMHNKIATEFCGVHNKEISRIAGMMWRNESEEVRNVYQRSADEEKLMHAIMNPGYKYKPTPKKRRKSATTTRRNTKSVKCEQRRSSSPDTSISTPTPSPIELYSPSFDPYMFQIEQGHLNEYSVPSQFVDNTVLDTYANTNIFDCLFDFDQLQYNVFY